MPDETNEQQKAENEHPDIRRMRTRIDELTEENQKLAGRVRESAFKEAGIDVTEGMGKAIARLYEGDSDPQAILEFAETEFGWNPSAGDQASGGPSTGTPSPGVQRVRESQERMDRVGTSSSPADSDTLDRQIEEAQKRGDVDASMSLKIAKFREEAGI